MKKISKLQFTSEQAKLEQKENGGRNIDVYMAAGISTEIDCDLSYGPPASIVYPNPFGFQCLSVTMLNKVNHLIQTQQIEKIWDLIKEAKEDANRIFADDRHKPSPS